MSCSLEELGTNEFFPNCTTWTVVYLVFDERVHARPEETLFQYRCGSLTALMSEVIV